MIERDFRYLRDTYGDAGARVKFEKICVELFQKLYRNAYPVREKQGDGGIDVFVGDFSDKIIVYQCKYFIDGIGESQKNQIRNSFKKAVESTDYTLKAWYLCIPCDLTIEENQWWAFWKDQSEKEYKINIEVIVGSRLLLMLHEADLYNKNFNAVTIDSNLFKDIISKDKKDKINQEFKEIMFFLENYSLAAVPFDIVENIDQLVIGYSQDTFFMNTNVINNLNTIAYNISLNSGIIRDKNVLNELEMLAKMTAEEYRNLMQ